ncbi:MAG: isoprenylcysteine carboxylmethyltransferase family protein [Candidatus Diapherotrites archaeon]|nr:isoprenylcysteine carboxylmethyltransferase family protein [Candidatus Diapherotrites archaeon]
MDSAIWAYLGMTAIYLLLESLAYQPSIEKGVVHRKWATHLLDAFFVILLAYPLAQYYFSPQALDEYATTLGIVLFGVGTVMRVGAMKALGKYYSGHLEIKRDHKLVKGGLYEFVRHPAYFGDLCIAFATPLYFNVWHALAFSLVFTALLLHRIHEEELVLSKRFPEYADYEKEAKCLIPFVW